MMFINASTTGVGGGIVLDGRLLNGRLGNAGHVGHIVVVPDGRPPVAHVSVSSSSAEATS